MEVTYFDSETRGIQYLYDQTPQEQFHLGQWAVEDGEILMSPDYDETRDILDSAEVIAGHNLFYDLTVMYGKDSLKPLELALEGRLIDTFALYPVKMKVPVTYIDRKGNRMSTYTDGKQKPELVKRFLSLGNLTHHHGLPGKEGDLVALAKKYNPEGTEKENLDFKKIPVDDPDFLVYAYNDIVALRALAKYMVKQTGGFTAYDWREMKVAAINNQMSKNGFVVNRELAAQRVKEMAELKREKMDWLVKHFDFPTAGKMPWRSKPGKEAIVNAFESFGLTPKTVDWELTKTGNISLGGQALKDVAEGTKALPLAEALASLMGQRTLPDLALRSTWGDGRAHPEITSLQRSGRFSMTNPSLPIWGSRTKELARDKEYFVATEGRKLVEMDFSNADQRIVAALSGDRNYAERFVPGADGHEITGRLMFGDDYYMAQMPEGWDNHPDPQTRDKLRKSNPLREMAKALSHAFAYGAGAKTLARTSKLPDTKDPNDPMNPLVLAHLFVGAMNTAYPRNAEWRDLVSAQGTNGAVRNTWGRKMAVDPGRSYTQSPGLIGQSGTREIMCDGLIRIAESDIEVMRWLVATIHDAVIWDIPEDALEWAVPFVRDSMEMFYTPGTYGSQTIHFPVSTGKPADNWMTAGH